MQHPLRLEFQSTPLLIAGGDQKESPARGSWASGWIRIPVRSTGGAQCVQMKVLLLVGRI